MSAPGHPLGSHGPTDTQYTATPAMTCTRFGYTATDGVEYEIAVFHRGPSTSGRGRQPESGAPPTAPGMAEDDGLDYGRQEREHEAGLRKDPYAGTPWLEAFKLVIRERRHARAWRGYGHATLLHRDRLPATGWQDAVRGWAAGPRTLAASGHVAEPCAELGAFARAHLVGDDQATHAAAPHCPGKGRGALRNGEAAAAFDGSLARHARLVGEAPPARPRRPLVVVERFLVYPAVWRRGLGRAAFDALAAALFERLRRPWAFVARPSYQRAETEAYLAELGAAVPLDEMSRVPAAFWANLGFGPFLRNTPWVYNLGRPVFATSDDGDGDDGDSDGTVAWSSEGGDIPPSSDDGLVVLFPAYPGPMGM